MLASTQLFSVLKFALPTIVIIWTLAYFTTSPSTYSEFSRKFKNEKELFVSDFLEHEIDGRFDGSSIAELCKSKTWTPGLFLSCDSPAGGVGTVKNAHLNCFRLAIEMGAELILPGIIRRNDKNIADVSPNAKAPIRGQEISYFFDEDHLNASLTTFCPQLNVYRSLSDLWEIPSLLTATNFNLADLGLKLTNTSVIEEPSLVASQIRQFVNTKSPPAERKHPVRFNLRQTNWAWPTESDGAAFARHFGRILRIRTDARLLAASALFNLHKRFGDLRIDPRQGIGGDDSFVGVHLRTEVDVLSQTDDAKKFPGYEEQAAYYLDYAVRSGNGVVYLATGATAANITAFVERARDFNITAVVKKDILTDAEDKSRLDGFSYDQRSLVDYEIMLRAGLMTGTSESPFAWNLAMRRRNAYGGSESAVESHGGDFVQFQDRYSTIFGKGDGGRVLQATIWP
ncbi:hypothetical protein GE09DRAFT_1140763 [Coniochaeta sp. 2T2.1]|nr:hypothetical protein GE09DRAFT_1140763 [Coniochaeta sp. 2T2.1]